MIEIFKFEKVCKRYVNFSIDEEVEELIRLAHIFQMKRQYEEHENVLLKAVNLNKNDNYAQYFYGSLLLRKNKKEEGWKFLNKVVNSDISDYFILAQLSAMLFHRGNIELSEKIIHKSIILKERGIIRKILDVNSEFNPKIFEISCNG
ncbi:hypothetical protein LCGC14_1262060 [marine sediment metagenome]|uniref:Uncharacterized protein n=1 Tax=marine sediment metagenome TaxID=412755 RepID=A0A0F9L2U6_9ZZZZ